MLHRAWLLPQANNKRHNSLCDWWKTLICQHSFTQRIIMFIAFRIQILYSFCFSICPRGRVHICWTISYYRGLSKIEKWSLAQEPVATSLNKQAWHYRVPEMRNGNRFGHTGFCQICTWISNCPALKQGSQASLSSWLTLVEIWPAGKK